MPRSTTIRTRLFAAVTTAALVVSGLLVTSAPASADTAPPVTTPATPTTVSADALPTVQIDGVVWAQVVVGNTVYAAGSFHNARPAGAAAGTSLTTRNNLLAYDITTGNLVTSFVPNINGQVLAIAASPDGKRLYVGGDFTNANGSTRSRIAAYDLTTKTLVANFKPAVQTTVRAIVATNTAVYFGGDFTTVNSISRPRLAAVDVATGSLLNWNPNADAPVTAMTMTTDGSKIVVGGRFQNVGGAAWYGMAAVNPTTGVPMAWAATTSIRNAGVNSDITSLTANGDSVYGTGYVYGAGGNLEGTFRANQTNGAVTWVEDCHGDSYSVYAGNPDLVYVASHSHYCGNLGGFLQTPTPWVMYRGTAFTKAVTRTLTTDPYSGSYKNWAGTPGPSMLNWFPTFTPGSYTGANQAGWSVTGNSQYTVYGGEFPSVNNVAQQGLVRFAVSTIAPNKIGPNSNDQLTPNVVAQSSGAVRVSWLQTFDRDNTVLTYKVYRNFKSTADTPIYQATGTNTFWQRSTMGFLDKTAVTGQTYNYRVYVSDPFGNTISRGATSITAPGPDANANVTYPNAVLADKPQTYWRLGEASATSAYDAVAFNDGVKSAGVTQSTDGIVAGDSNTASAFDGKADGFFTTQTPVSAPNTFSVEAWVKTASTSGGKVIGFGTANSGNSGSYDRQIYLDNAGHLYFGVYNGGTKVVSTTGTYNDNQWHQVVATLGANGMQLFVDGKSVGTNATVTAGQTMSGYWRVGGDNLSAWPSAPTSNYLAGAIDEVAIYPSVLTSTQVSSHFAARSAPVNHAPTAAFSSSAVNLAASFDGSASADADGSVASYSWDFGDNSAAASGVKPSHTYAAGGTYQVVLTVTDNDGATASVTHALTVGAANQAPTAAFSSSAANLVAAFDGSASADADGSVASYSWDFGDSSAAGSGVKPSHTFAAAGTYQVVLTVTDDKGAKTSVTHAITVTAANKAPTASFSSSSANLVASFDGSASADADGSVASYSWNFGDSSAAGSGVKPSHTYAAAGTYQVVLTVTDDKGATGSVTKAISVVASGVAPFARDQFGRTVANGLGTADLGGAWTVAGTASQYAVNGSAAKLTLGAPAASPTASLASASSTSADVKVDVSLDKPATGGGVYLYVVGRRVSSTTDYRSYVKISSTGQITLVVSKRVAGTETVLSSKVVAGVTFVAGTPLTLRFQVSGTSSVALNAKVWTAGATEPAAWQAAVTDSTAELAGAGGIGVATYLSGSATNSPVVATFDNLSAQPVN